MNFERYLLRQLAKKPENEAKVKFNYFNKNHLEK